MTERTTAAGATSGADILSEAAKYDAAQMKAMMAKGQAMKNDQGQPSYPIADEEDLRNAIKAVGRGGGSHDAIRAHIVKRAKALGKSDLIPDNWSSSGAKSENAKPGNPFTKEKQAVKESADPGDGKTSGRRELVEVSEAVRSGTGRRRKIQLIKAGWSKNGRYYPASTLAEAADLKIFAAGTPMYANHPTATEKIERPERSIADLAARLDTDARYENGALVAEATHFGPWHTILNGPDGIAEQCEISVRCFGEVEFGEAEGREGLLVTGIEKGISVDYVTEGAAGGKVLELIESVQELDESGSVGAWLESRIHCEFTNMADQMYGQGRLTREERIALSTAIGEALGTFVTQIESGQPQLYQRDLYENPEVMSESGKTGITQEREEMTESTGGTPPTPGTTRALVERELTEARRERDLAVARERAREFIPQAIAEAWITPSTAIRITESVMSRLPVTDGRLDETELAKITAREVEQAEREMAEALQAAGVGSPRELSTSRAQSGFGVDRAELTDRLGKALGSMGLSESATKRAVQGRD